MKTDLIIEEGGFSLSFYDCLRKEKDQRKRRYRPYLKAAAEVFSAEMKKQISAKYHYQFAVHLVGDQKIRRLNSDYRQKDKKTDVLSFPTYESMEEVDLPPGMIVDFGDIFVCHSKTLSQAKEFEISEQEEFIHLVVHGFLHLIGYDHERSKEDEKIMENLERKLLKAISRKKGK